jgi:PD-(D/E)XK nuclease superfamily
VTLEERLTSDDGLLKGRPDRVEKGRSEVVIVDYKTGSLENPENLGRYEQQCLFYAWLWREHHGTLPSRYRLVNPLTGKEHGGDVDPQAAEALAEDARRLALRLSGNHPPAEEQASPGEACVSCEFRPWCEPFWRRAARPSFEVPTYGDRKRVSFQGAVREVRTQTNAVGLQAFVRLRVERGAVTLQAPLPDFSHVGVLRNGERVRVLDALVSPEDEGWLRLDGRSEAFVLVR